MRRIVLWAMSTLTVLVLLFSYNTSRSSSAAQVTAETRSATSSGQAAGSSSGSSTGSPTSSSAGGSSSSSAASATTVSGDEVMTRYGVVQVQITVANGKITSSKVLQVPWNDGHDRMINSQAVPVYNDEAVQAQSSNIDVVSGATVTWQGYAESLQSAIDKANI